MGCDIHFYVEREEKGRWVSADQWSAASVPPRRIERYYDDRNYRLFAILADVRNGFGFAGVKTGGRLQPIDAPRGVPDDVSDAVAQEISGYGVDGHSHSYFTVRELMQYDWAQVAECCGKMSAGEFATWDWSDRERGEEPQSWCGDILGGQQVRVSMEEMALLIKPYKDTRREHWDNYSKLVQEAFPHHLVTCRWEVPYYRVVGSFWSRTIPKLCSLMHKHELDWEQVRIVFFFDN